MLMIFGRKYGNLRKIEEVLDEFADVGGSLKVLMLLEESYTIKI